MGIVFKAPKGRNSANSSVCKETQRCIPKVLTEEVETTSVEPAPWVSNRIVVVSIRYKIPASGGLAGLAECLNSLIYVTGLRTKKVQKLRDIYVDIHLRDCFGRSVLISPFNSKTKVGQSN